MLIDFWTKSGTHYRADDNARTVECVGPEPFAPFKCTDAVFDPQGIVVGRKAIVPWVNGGPTGNAVMRTSEVVRVERSA